MKKKGGLEENIGEINPKEFKFRYLIGMDILRQEFPGEYEKAKDKEVQIFFYPYKMDGFGGEPIANYCIGCFIPGVMGGMPGHYKIPKASDKKVDELLKGEIEILKKEGFTNINYSGRLKN